MGSSELRAEIRRERIQIVLGPIVRRTAEGVGDPSEHGRDIDDLSCLPLLEMGEHLLHAVESRLHVHVHHRVNVIGGQLRWHPRDPLTGIIDPDVDVSEFREHSRHGPPHRRAVSHVRHHDHRLRSATRRDTLERVFPPGNKYHRCATG